MSELVAILDRKAEPETLSAIAVQSFRPGNGGLLVQLSSDSRSLSLRSEFGVGFLRLISELLDR